MAISELHPQRLDACRLQSIAHASRAWQGESRYSTLSMLSRARLSGRACRSTSLQASFPLLREKSAPLRKTADPSQPEGFPSNRKEGQMNETCPIWNTPTVDKSRVHPDKWPIDWPRAGSRYFIGSRFMNADCIVGPPSSEPPICRAGRAGPGGGLRQSRAGAAAGVAGPSAAEAEAARRGFADA